MATSKKVGVDGGNGNLKLWLEGSDEGLLIASVQDKMLNKRKDNVIGGVNITEEEIVDYLDVTFLSSPALSITGEEERYALGNYHLKEFKGSSSSELSVKSKKYEDDIPARTILAGLLYDAIRNNPNKKNVKVKYDLSMSLPLIDTDPTAYEKNQNRYIGEHKMIYHYPDGQTTVNVTIDVEFATTNPEGGIGAYSVVYNTSGDPIVYEMEIMGETFKDTLEDYPLLSLDIGSGTTELAASMGVKFNYSQSEALELGCRDVIFNIMNDWNREKGNENDQISTNAQFVNLYYSGRSFRQSKVRNYSKEYLKAFAKSVVVETVKQYKVLAAIHGSDVRIPVFGGGALLIQHYLEEFFEQEKLAHAVIFVEDPLFVNARGSYIFTKMKAYEARKKAYLDSLKETIK